MYQFPNETLMYSLFFGGCGVSFQNFSGTPASAKNIKTHGRDGPK